MMIWVLRLFHAACGVTSSASSKALGRGASDGGGMNDGTYFVLAFLLDIPGATGAAAAGRRHQDNVHGA